MYFLVSHEHDSYFISLTCSWHCVFGARAGRQNRPTKNHIVITHWYEVLGGGTLAWAGSMVWLGGMESLGDLGNIEKKTPRK